MNLRSIQSYEEEPKTKDYGINNRYLIVYYPHDQERNIKRRNVKIEVKNHPEYRIICKKFYYAPEQQK